MAKVRAVTTKAKGRAVATKAKGRAVAIKAKGRIIKSVKKTSKVGKNKEKLAKTRAANVRRIKANHKAGRITSAKRNSLLKSTKTGGGKAGTGAGGG